MPEIDVSYMPVWRRYLDAIREVGMDMLSLGELHYAMMEYYFEGKVPTTLTGDAKAFWILFRKDLDYARKRYEAAVLNGRKGGRPKKVKEPEKTQVNPAKGITITETESISESLTESMSITNIESAAVPAEQQSLCMDQTSYGEYGWIQLTDDQYQALEQEMGAAELRDCIRYIDEAAQSNNNRNHWSDWYLVLRRCYQKGWHTSSTYVRSNKDVPMGASGHLGEAELEAIQRVLRS